MRRPRPSPADGAAPPAGAILGVPVHATDLTSATRTILRLADSGQPHMVLLRDAASLMQAVDDPALLSLHGRASLVLADGAPVALAGRLAGHAVKRTPGADLVDAVCAASLATGQRHFFYGGRPGIAERMAANLATRHPGLAIAGTLTPPMRDIDAAHRLDAESRRELERIRGADPDFIWVGLSSPKQDFWMALALPHLRRGVCLGVGAAFDFQSGAMPRAPRWMRDNGLEWLHRLWREPRRLWRRYLVLAPRFVLLFAAERLFRRKGGRP